MTRTDTPDTAGPTRVPIRFDVREDATPGAGFSWSDAAIRLSLLLAGVLFAWGGGLLFAPSMPAFVPALPGSRGGIDLLAAGLVLALGPVGIRSALADRRRRRLEGQFPDLLTDLAANRRAGFTLAESVRLAALGDYGPLTPYVQRMAAQLSWNVPFEEALRRFAHRADAPLVTRATTLILEAERSGGQMTDVLAAVAVDAREIRHLDRERRFSMRAYTIVMYVTFLVFLGVVAVLESRLLPELLVASEVRQSELFSPGQISRRAYRTFFYTAAIVQALGSGSMAGVMSRGRVGPGLLHAAAMLLVTVFTFSSLLV